MKIDTDAGASRGRSWARDTKYRRSGRVARIPRTTYFLFPLPRGGVRRGTDSPATRHGALSRILLRRDRRRRARKSTCRPVRRGAAVSSISQMTKTRRTCSQREGKKREKRKKKKERKRCGRLYFLKHDGKRYPQETT